jgi:hypothetical protein
MTKREVDCTGKRRIRHSEVTVAALADVAPYGEVGSAKRP